MFWTNLWAAARSRGRVGGGCRISGTRNPASATLCVDSGANPGCWSVGPTEFWPQRWCSKAMSGPFLVPLLQCASLTATLFASYESKYSVLSTCSASIARYKQEKQVQLDVVLTHLICTRVASPLLARCCFTVLSNQNSQGSRGVTTVCLVYSGALSPKFAQNRGFPLKIAWRLHDFEKILGARGPRIRWWDSCLVCCRFSGIN